MCVRVRRTVVALSCGSGHDAGGYRYVGFELHIALSGDVAARGRSEQRLLAACAICVPVVEHQLCDTSGSSARVNLRVCT